MPSAVAAQNIGVEPCRGMACGDMLEAMARIPPSQLNETIARIACRSPMDPTIVKFHSTKARKFFGLDSIFFRNFKWIRKEDWAK
jgi:hypothetical protein